MRCINLGFWMAMAGGASALAGCSEVKRGESPGPSAAETDDGAGGSGDEGGGPLDDGEAEGEGGTEDGDTRFDVGNGDELPCAETGTCPACSEVAHTPCDGQAADFAQIIGLGCEGELEVEWEADAASDAIGFMRKFGTTTAFAAQEGEKFLVLGSGKVGDLPKPNDFPPPLNVAGGFVCDTDNAGHDVGTLPAPILAQDVAGDCLEDPSLLGTGDCSNTVEREFERGSGAFDYADLRMTIKVPDNATSLSFDHLFMTTEYPFYTVFGDAKNDTFVVWMEGRNWTGNIAFDDQGSPMSANASFFDYRDDQGVLVGLAGTCMRWHGATRWLTTTAPVVPGDTITLIFAIFDIDDPQLDSYAFVDNFRWGCEGDGKPVTKPVG